MLYPQNTVNRGNRHLVKLTGLAVKTLSALFRGDD